MIPAREKILLVDDEKDILEILRYHLEKEGYLLTCVTSGEEALERARASLPDLIVLDLMLPGIDGLSVCRMLKNDPRTSAIPIVILTAKGDEADIIVGLELGADDYITKPFSPRILLARVKTIIRRKKTPIPHENSPIKMGEMVIDPVRHQVVIAATPVALTPTEFGILQLLARRPGAVFTRSQIIDAVMGENIAVTDRTVDVHIVPLRKKLGAYGSYIETVRGVGYRLKE
ncbi:MAG: response regulator transcription factor [Deltaproteobacteria bacterium]|nr:response regulator transcription factor [Deltaproteobacteria bacterium]MBW2306920.1 response regulator transcription factor [Deltaproteobacteria bacterium]